MVAVNIHDIRKFEILMEKAGRCAVVTHAKPDGDAMGSSIGMYFYLKSAGKENVKIILSDPYPDNLAFMVSDEVRKDIIIHERNSAEAEAETASSDLIICVDFNAFHRTDRLEKALTASKAAKVLIDHHLNPDTDRFKISFSETAMSSASELLYHVLMSTGTVGHDARNLPKETAYALMTGVTTDTNNFANSTYPSTLRMTADLLETGVDRDLLISELYNRHRENRLRLMGHAMHDMLRITGDGVAYIVLDAATLEKYDVRDGETEGFVNMPLSIEEVKMSLLLKEEEEKVRVSIRSKKGTSANRCAKMYFNGGGHENAAGGRLFKGKEIADIGEAPAYIERHTHIFMTEENENR